MAEINNNPAPAPTPVPPANEPDLTPIIENVGHLRVEGNVGGGTLSDGRTPDMAGLHYGGALKYRLPFGAQSAWSADFGLGYLRRGLSESASSTVGPGTDNRTLHAATLPLSLNWTTDGGKGNFTWNLFSLSFFAGSNTFEQRPLSAVVNSAGESPDKAGTVHVEGFGTPKEPGQSLGVKAATGVTFTLWDRLTVGLEGGILRENTELGNSGSPIKPFKQNTTNGYGSLNLGWIFGDRTVEKKPTVVTRIVEKIVAAPKAAVPAANLECTVFDDAKLIEKKNDWLAMKLKIKDKPIQIFNNDGKLTEEIKPVFLDMVRPERKAGITPILKQILDSAQVVIKAVPVFEGIEPVRILRQVVIVATVNGKEGVLMNNEGIESGGNLVTLDMKDIAKWIQQDQAERIIREAEAEVNIILKGGQFMQLGTNRPTKAELEKLRNIKNLAEFEASLQKGNGDNRILKNFDDAKIALTRAIAKINQHQAELGSRKKTFLATTDSRGKEDDNFLLSFRRAELAQLWTNLLPGGTADGKPIVDEAVGKGENPSFATCNEKESTDKDSCMAQNRAVKMVFGEKDSVEFTVAGKAAVKVKALPVYLLDLIYLLPLEYKKNPFTADEMATQKCADLNISGQVSSPTDQDSLPAKLREPVSFTKEKPRYNFVPEVAEPSRAGPAPSPAPTPAPAPTPPPAPSPAPAPAPTPPAPPTPPPAPTPAPAPAPAPTEPDDSGVFDDKPRP